jgi:hypothetical protein
VQAVGSGGWLRPAASSSANLRSRAYGLQLPVSDQDIKQ